MKRAFGIVCIVCVIYLAALMAGFYNYEIKEQNEIEQLILSYAVDYSADGAMYEALDVKDIATDYSDDNKRVKIDPNSILDSFLDIFCISYNIGRSPEAKQYVSQNFIPVACVACYDGYYIAKLQPTKCKGQTLYPSKTKLLNSRWNLVFGPKMPYLYEYIDKYTGAKTCYAINMGMNYAYTTRGERREGELPGLHNEQAGFIKINKILSEEIENSINYINSANVNWKNKFRIPMQFSSYNGVNPIQGPSFIIMVQNIDIRTTKPISGFSIAGTKVEKARAVVGYRRKGKDYYCYADIAPDVSKEPDMEITDVFSDVNDAALSGYYCDLKYMN